MAGIFSDLSKLDLDDVEERVYAKYDVSSSDARLAVEYLRCFFDAKRRAPNQLIILPQIADWAWHELILDTGRYRMVCFQVLGKFLHHITTPSIDPDAFFDDRDVDLRDLRTELEPARTLSKPGLVASDLRERFQESLAMMWNVYGLGLGSNPGRWREAGWDSPRYRLRKPIRFPHHLEKVASSARGSDRLKQAPFLTWLPSRIVRRFGIPLAAAHRGAEEYCDFFLSLRSANNQIAHEECSILCEIAWEEHVLWTQRYAGDCDRLLGYFLDHVPRADFSNAENSTTFEAA
jgi:hypothetical protein